MTSRRPLAATVILAWLSLVMAAVATPAAAVQEIRLEAPARDSVVAGPFEVIVRVRPDDGEVIERVESLITGDAQRTLGLVAADAVPDAEGYLTWQAIVDPSDGLALPNGSYTISLQVSPPVGATVTAEGHAVRLAVPPPRRDLMAEPTAGDATTVSLTWQPVDLPDFVGYRIQRRDDDASGTWVTVHDLTDSLAEGILDPVEQPGRYRYRLIVVRRDGAGGELFTTSAPQGVQADPESPGTFTAPPEPDPRPNLSPSPTPTPTQVQANATPTPTPSGPPSTARPPALGPVTGNPPSPAAPRPTAPPAVVPFDDGVFEELLPFDVTESEITVLQTETAFLDGATREGGTLAVLTEQPRDRGFVTATAAGLLLIVISAHVRRFLSLGRSR